MDPELLNTKVYLIKTRTIPPGFSLQIHHCRWVSPRPNELRVDKRIDIPYVNMIFIEAHIKGDPVTGERFLDLGVVGFPKLIRMPFSSLSPNEFRFPSKNVDQNVRHTALEIIKAGRVFSMGEEMFHFLTGKPILTLENQTMVDAHVRSLISLVKDKLPFRCNSCKKFLWINISKLPEKPTKARCPACSNLLQVETPEGLDLNLKRYLEEEEEKSGKTGDILLSLTGEIRTKDATTGELRSSTGPVKVAGPRSLSETGQVASIDLDIDSILGIVSEPVPAPAKPAPPPTAKKESVADIDYAGLADELGITSPEPVGAGAPANVKGGEIDYAGIADELGISAPAAAEAAPPPARAAAGPAKGPYVPPAGIDLDEDFFKEIMPVGPSASAASDENAPAKLSDDVGSEDDGILRELTQGVTGTKVCHVCGADVGSEKVCPSCFAEQVDSLSFDDYQPSDDGHFEIRLKEDARPRAHAAEAAPAPAADADAGGEPEKRKVKEEEKVPYWEEPIWSVRIGSEVYTDLTIVTIEEWILGGSVIESDQVRKGEARWMPVYMVPYFQEAVKKKKHSVPLDKDADGLFTPATPYARMKAFCIDLPILAALEGVGYLGATLAAKEWDTVAYCCLGAILPILFLAVSEGKFGGTPGKKLSQIMVVNMKGHRIGILTALFRTLLRIGTLGFGFLLGVWGRYGQTFYDKALRCFVVNAE